MNIPESMFNSLTDEQRKKIETAKSPEELLAVAKETGYELSDEQLAGLSGGSFWDNDDECGKLDECKTDVFIGNL